jgi:hypothetical protein
MTEKQHIAFVAPVEMAEALRELSAREDRSVSATLRQMVREHLNENGGAEPGKPDTSKDGVVKDAVNGTV